MNSADPFDRLNLEQAATLCGIHGEMRSAVLQAAAEIQANPEQREAARHYHAALFRTGEDQIAAAAGWPKYPATASAGERLMFAVVCLAGLAELRRQHEARGIPEQVTWDTMQDLPLWMRHRFEQIGVWMFDKIDWLVRHCQCKLFQLGRLQIELARCHSPVQMVRHRELGWIVGLSEGERVIDPDGKVTEETLQRQPEWESILQPGDPILDVHIPAAGPILWSQLQEFTNLAAGFVRSHLTDHPARLLQVKGWLIDPEFEALLPARSLMRRMRRALYLLPVEGGSHRPLVRSVFGNSGSDVSVPASSFQKVVAAAIQSGVQFKGGQGVRLIDEPELDEGRYWRSFDHWRASRELRQ